MLTEQEILMFWLKLAFSLILTLIMIFVVVAHFVNIISDLCTESRKAVLHRNERPKINLKYKVLAWLTFVSVVLFAIAIITNSLVIYNYKLSLDLCAFNYWLQVICVGTYMTAKLFMYLVFLLRLVMVYGSSSYAYNTNCLLIIAIIFVIITLAIIIIHVFAYRVHALGYNGLFIICDGTFNAIATLLVAITDFSAAFGFIAAFLYPLWKNVNLLRKYHATNPRLHSLINIGLKATILTTTAGISTIIVVLIIGLLEGKTGVFFGYFAAPLEFIVNSLCILLMTPYYSDDKYYRKMCCIMIKCCSKLGINDEIQHHVIAMKQSTQSNV
eukprot:464435_1